LKSDLAFKENVYSKAVDERDTLKAQNEMLRKQLKNETA
jgi:hypothetical protein